jgi:hypothetical protein
LYIGFLLLIDTRFNKARILSVVRDMAAAAGKKTPTQ